MGDRSSQPSCDRPSLLVLQLTINTIKAGIRWKGEQSDNDVQLQQFASELEFEAAHIRRLQRKMDMCCGSLNQYV